MKKALFISILSVTTMLTASVLAATGTWNCGSNCVVTLDEAGTLTVSGTGAMRDYDASNPPWMASEIAREVKSIVISDGITHIGGRALCGSVNATSVSIPNSVTSIGDRAFASCTSLTSVTIPDSVTKIDMSAFYGNTSLTDVKLGNSVQSIGWQAFARCTSLTNIEIPDSVTSIGEEAFAWDPKLTNIDLGDSVTTIDRRAFYGTAITELVLPDSAILIADNAFGGMNSLTDIVISDSGTFTTTYEDAYGVTQTAIHNPFRTVDLSKVTLHCAGVLEDCKQNMATMGYEEGSYTMVSATKLVENPDGSYTVQTYDGKFLGYKGKRIYTVEEAEKISKPTGNKFKIKYK